MGFHGCDAKVGDAILSSKTKHLTQSQNDYDWLGNGIYFWENSPQRALEFAQDAAENPKLTRGKIKTPFVVGAIIDLGLCLNMLDATALGEVKGAYSLLASLFKDKSAMPKNSKSGQRFLDCAVFETLHAYREQQELIPYESVRGVFVEGTPLYKGAGFNRQDHVQICVLNTDCIKGYFRPLELNLR